MNLDPVERYLFLEGLFLRYGYDFRQYSEASLNRRLESVIRKANGQTLLQILEQALHQKDYFERILSDFTVTTSECFRDPPFFKSLRTNVIPVLRTHPSLNIWVAGCSTGEELYSLLILLKEENLLERSNVFATDINTEALKRARNGIFDQTTIRIFTKNYVEAGGLLSPSDYYTADFGFARFDPALSKNVIFSQHNLATDEVFAEMHLILCRNVLIYFKQTLQDRVLNLFCRSLGYRGFLTLGSKESLRFSESFDSFEGVDEKSKIFRKKGAIAVSSPHREAQS